jgi:hypothetical protein
MTASSSWECSSRWTRAGMRFFALSLNHLGDDINDVIQGNGRS